MRLAVGDIILEKKVKRLIRTDMYSWFFKLGVFLLITGCSSYKFDESLLKLNENEEIGAVGQITTVTSESQRKFLNDRAATLLNAELGEDEAIELMIVKSPDFQSLLFDHRSRLAEAAQQGRISNPAFSFERMVKGAETEYGRFLSFGLLELFTLPLRKETSKISVELGHVKLEAEVFEKINDLRIAWYDAVASQKRKKLYEDAFIALSANAELAKRMKKTGNMTTSDRIRQQLILSGATVAIAEARMKNISAREMLTRKIGLSRDEANVMDLPQALPEAPQDPISIGDLEYEINNRLDVQAARLEYELLLKGLGLDELSSYTDIELGYRNDRINDAGSISNKKGYELEVKIPIFDWGDLQRDAVQSELTAKQQRYKNTVLAAASELRESYQGYRTAYDIAKHYKDQIIPMYETLLDEATYEYNGMIIGVFELVQVGLEKASAEIRAIDALQNLHLAELKLNSVLVGGQMGLETNAISDAPAKKAKGH